MTCRSRCLRAVLVAVGLVASAPTTAAAQDEGPDIVEVLNQFFASGVSEDVREHLGWTRLPTPIRAGDPPDDHFPLDPASNGFLPADADLTGFAVATTGPLDDRAFEVLFGPDGSLRLGATGVVHPTGYEVDTNAFRDGLLITLVVPREPGTALTGSDERVVAVEAFDPRFPAPPSGTFQDINKAWRYEVNAEGIDLSYLQFDGARFSVFQSDTVVVDTCAAGASPCEYWFITALGNPEVEGIDDLRVELFRRQGAQAAADRNGAGTGEPVAFASLAPGELGFIALPAPPAEEPAAGAGEEAVDEPGDVAVPSPVAADGGGGGGGVLVPLLLIGGGVVLLGGGGVVLRRARAEPSVLSYLGEADGPPSVLSYTETATPAAVDEEAVRDQWAQLLRREEEIQQRLLADYERIGGIVAGNLRTFTTALAAYDKGFQEVAWHANWLQGVADETRTAMGYTAGIDLVLGVGPGLWRLGRGGWQRVGGWWRGGDEAADAAVGAAGASTNVATTAQTALERGRAVIARSEDLSDLASELNQVNIAGHVEPGVFVRHLDDVFAEAAALADEAGVDFAAIARQRIDALRFLTLRTAVSALWIEMAEAVAASRGWVRASDELRDVITEVVVNVRGYCQARVVGSTEELRNALVALDTLAQQPGFWEMVPRLYTVVGDARSVGQDIALELLYHADDVAFLRWAANRVAMGDDVADLPAMWKTVMGPVGTAGDALSSGAGLGVGTGTVLSLANGIDSGMRLFDVYSGPATATSILPDGVSYVAQFGILRPTFLGFEAGDSLPLTVLLNGVNSVGGLTTWLTGMRGSIEGGLLHDDAMAELQPTFGTMLGASLDMVNVLQVVSDRVTTDSIGVDDRNDLRALVDQMRAVVNSAGPLRDELVPQYEERRAHIERKLAQLDSVQGSLVTAAGGLPAIASALDAAVRNGRAGAQWADPVLADGFAVAATALHLLAVGILRPPVPVDTTPRGPEVLDRDFSNSYLTQDSDAPDEPSEWYSFDADGNRISGSFDSEPADGGDR